MTGHVGKADFKNLEMLQASAQRAHQKEVSTFLYCLGEEAESVLASMAVTTDDRKDYAAILQKVNGFFQVCNNVIYERACFNRRNKQSGKTAEQYIMALYDLAQHCNYWEMKD